MTESATSVAETLVAGLLARAVVQVEPLEAKVAVATTAMAVATAAREARTEVSRVAAEKEAEVTAATAAVAMVAALRAAAEAAVVRVVVMVAVLAMVVRLVTVAMTVGMAAVVARWGNALGRNEHVALPTATRIGYTGRASLLRKPCWHTHCSRRLPAKCGREHA